VEAVETYLKKQRNVHKIIYLSQILSKKKKKESFLDLIGDNSKLSIKLDTSINPTNFKFSFNHIYNDIAFSGILTKEYSLLLQHELCIESAKGNLKLLYNEFAKNLSNKYKITDEMTFELLEKAKENNIIFIQNRQFTKSKQLKFVSLRVPLYFSHENFIWVINSLIKDKVML
jgi:hypothetical protein